MNSNPNRGGCRKEEQMNAVTNTTAGAVLVALGLAATISALCAEEPMKQPTTSNTPNPAGSIANVFQPVDLRKVKVGGELGRRMEITANNNLLKIAVDKDFLAPFVGGPFTGIGWPNEPCVGFGAVIESASCLAANTGNETLNAFRTRLVEALIKSQKPDGYIGILPPERRTWGLYDVHEQGFLINGLVADAHYCDARGSLEAAKRLADYIIKRYEDKPTDWEKRIPVKHYFAECGTPMAFLRLYAATKDRRYLDFCAREFGIAALNYDIVLGRRPPFDGHSALYLSICEPQVELYRHLGDEKMLAMTQRALDFMLAKDGMTIGGGAGQFECWTDDQNGSDKHAETCHSVYAGFLFDSLLRMRGESKYGDLIERVLYNVFFAAQSPDGRRIRYYTPFEGKRKYFQFDSYCCPNMFRRLIGHVPELIYYRVGNGVAVSLYSASETTLDRIGGTTVGIRQETDYPASGKVAILVEPAKAAKFAVLLRMPRWCAKPVVAVNGKPVKDAPKAGEFLRIDREWRAGDRIDVDFPMPVRFIAGRKTQAGRAAVMRGPVVYTLNPAKIAGADPVSDLKRLVLLPATAELAPDDKSIRPDGTACRIKADLDKADKGAYTLTLTEFPDPDGQWTYFQLADPKVAVEDELMTEAK